MIGIALSPPCGLGSFCDVCLTIPSGEGTKGAHPRIRGSHTHTNKHTNYHTPNSYRSSPLHARPAPPNGEPPEGWRGMHRSWRASFSCPRSSETLRALPHPLSLLPRPSSLRLPSGLQLLPARTVAVAQIDTVRRLQKGGGESEREGRVPHKE